MSKKSVVFVSVILVVTLVILALVVPRIYGTAILKSKSNIASNRTAGPVPAPIVICESCNFADMPEQGYLVLMDSETGDVFAYSDAAVIGKEAPKYVSTFTGVGKPFVRIAAK